VTPGAILSPCGAFRYLLWREWDASLPCLLWVMLNPSTADASTDDATIRKCMAFARLWGFGSIRVVNLYAYRTVSPAELKRAAYSVGFDNNVHLFVEFQRHKHIVCAWGANAQPERVAFVMRMLQVLDRQPQCLTITKDGQPGHPLYVPMATPLRRYP
jgi:hypothetical protein